MSQLYDTKYKVGDKVEMFSNYQNPGESVGIVGILERDCIPDEYPDVIINGKCHDLADEVDSYYLKKILTVLLIFFCLNGFAQTWPTKDCPDKPYTKGNDDIIYHTCDCGLTETKFIIDTAIMTIKHFAEPDGHWKYFPGVPHEKKTGFILCPTCNKYSSIEHIDEQIYNGSIVYDKKKRKLRHTTEAEKRKNNWYK